MDKNTGDSLSGTLRRLVKPLLSWGQASDRFLWRAFKLEMGFYVYLFRRLFKKVDQSTKLIREHYRETSNDYNAEVVPKEIQHFHDHVEAGEHGEQLLSGQLEAWKGNLITDFITTRNLEVDGDNFEIDFLLLVPDYGLVLVESKYYSGTTYCSNHRSWKQFKKHGGEVRVVNASSQVMRTRWLLKKVLGQQGILKWTVRPVVVFTHPGGSVVVRDGKNKPDAEILTLVPDGNIEALEKWLRALPKKENCKFTAADSQVIQQALSKYEKAYQAA